MHLCRAPAANGRSDFSVPAAAHHPAYIDNRWGGPERVAAHEFTRGSDGIATATEEVPHDGNEREQQEQVDQRSGDVEDTEAKKPGQDQDDRQGEKHGVFIQSDIAWPAGRAGGSSDSDLCRPTTDPTNTKARGIPGWGSLRALAFGTTPDHQACCTVQCFDLGSAVALAAHLRASHVISHRTVRDPTRVAPMPGSCTAGSCHHHSLAIGSVWRYPSEERILD